MRKFGKGLLPPNIAKLSRRSEYELSKAPVGTASLTPSIRYDQGQTPTCGPHSAAGVVWTAANAAGLAFPTLSPKYIASTTYADIRAVNFASNEQLPPLQYQGIDLSDAAMALKTWGVAGMAKPLTNDGRVSDIELPPPSNIFPEPDLGQLFVGGDRLISGEYQIPVTSVSPATCALAIDNNAPIWVGFYCDTAFQELTSASIAQPADLTDPSGGGHAVYLSSYRTAADGTFEFLIQNSWGSDWAIGGSVWASSAWVTAAWMLWPFPISVSS